MKSNQKLAILFWLKKSKTTNDGMAPLYVRITIDGKDEAISLSKKVNPDYWDTKLKKVTEPTTNAKAVNLKIGQVENDLNRHFIVLQSQYEKITPVMLKNAFLGLPVFFTQHSKNEPEVAKDKTLLASYDTFIKKFEKQVERKQRSYETLKHWKSTKTKVEAFINYQYGLNDFDLTDIKFSFALKFYDYLTLEVDEPLAEVSAKTHIKKTKQILNGCVKEELISKNPIKEFKCSGGEQDVEPLEMYQVQTIAHKKLTIERLAEVRDAFIFQCFTGFAFQDIYALTSDNIVRVGNNGERWLIKDRGKTGVSEMVPILPIVEQLIEKYSVHRCCKRTGCLIPVNSNGRYNGYLKELADICGIKRELNTHLARHTFADMMLNNGVPLEDVSKMLGHKNIRTTQRYCKVRKNRISQNMELIRQKLFTSTGELRKVS